MPQDKIEFLEKEVHGLQVTMSKVEWLLENIERYIKEAISIKEIVVTHREKHKVVENRLLNIERDIKELSKTQIWINLKIAMASWAWWVLIFALSKV